MVSPAQTNVTRMRRQARTDTRPPNTFLPTLPSMGLDNMKQRTITYPATIMESFLKHRGEAEADLTVAGILERDAADMNVHQIVDRI